MATVLVVDDDVLLCQTLEARLRRLGHKAESVHTLAEAGRHAATVPYDVIFLDVMLPDGNGIAIIPELRRTRSIPEIIIITGHGDPDGAELAIKNGAWGYVEKGNVVKEMILPLTRALEYREERHKNSQMAQPVKRDGIVGMSPSMTQALELLGQAAGSDVSVLITGETGTGKELFAKGIHENSDRADGPFVVVDCASLPETLAEGLLFGHVRGAFTDARRESRGLIHQAHNGTLFLDEIGELPAVLQKTFLRVLQEKRFRPIGAEQELTSDFRLVAATNRDLTKMAGEGLFRSDLLFRLRSFVIDLPPLRARSTDVEGLAGFFVRGLRSRYGRGPEKLASDLLEALRNYEWPGNVRELRQAMERAFAASIGQKTIYAGQLPQEIRIRLSQKALTPGKTAPELPPPFATSPPATPWQEAKDAMERQYFQKLLAQANGNISQASRIAGLSRARLYQILQKHRLHPSAPAQSV